MTLYFPPISYHNTILLEINDSKRVKTIPISREMLRQFTTSARKHHPKLVLGLPPSTIHKISHKTSSKEIKELRRPKI
jgi:hypothetical protein